jgi:YgiT-type zinc finger domain-containing protein
MTCVICKHGETEPGVTTVTLERGGLTLVLKRVPARVCPNCGEAYISDAIASRLLDNAEALAKAGAVVDVREYAGA